ncbi:RHS repeat-associated protein [Tumebacillus sp. BK434]|uniref:DNRLRE domain-containing protein n=1 Tax=Tumebacillus sp. BK434 TaxID=2512169 RepID=UPI0010F1A583|nr:DNRLRE domain-containing protein [Tumebacillus sp. BK434]TCP54653.1 RHS repeat-associated protein [Tumebacillus sp. BK434]
MFGKEIFVNIIYKFRLIRYVLIPLLTLALVLAPMAPYSVLSLFTGTDTAEAAIPKELPKKKFPDRPTKGQKVEIPEWRSANSKHFLKDDGYFEVEVSKNSMFYQDKGTKKWLDIDNSLVLSNKKGFGYKNKANRFDAQFAGGANTGSIMQLNLENASMELLPLGIGNGAGVVKDNMITYTNAFQQTDLVYTVESDVVKEELVLKKADAPSVYLFELKLNNLKYVAKEDGSIEIQYADTSKFAFEFPKPFMFESGDLPQSDNVKEHSDSVTQTIRQQGDKLLLELKADQAWLQAPEREFPVVIDPTADMTMMDETRISDTFASRNNPTIAYNTASHMYVGNTTSYGETQSYILFPLPGLPDGSRVTDAKMKLYNYLTKTTTTNVDVYEVTSGWWPASAITWNTRPSVGQKVTTKGIAAAGWSEFNITSAVKKWYEGKLDNWGLQLTAGTQENVGFTANDNTSAAYRPVLTMEYWVDPEGTNHFWEYTEDGVSPFKGNLYLSETDVSIPGRGVVVSLNRSYNSRQTTEKGMFGPNWLSDLDMRVWELFGSVAFLDNTGTRHVFNRSHSPEDSYVPPAGVSLALNRGNEYWEISTPDNIVYYFDRTYKMLRKITDSNRQTTTYTYNSNDSNWTMLTIKDASGRLTTVQRTGGKVSTVTEPSGRKTTYGYDSTQGGALASVTLSDAAGTQTITTRYTYDQGQADTTNRRLKSITDPNGNSTVFTYDIYDRLTEVSKKINGVDVVKTYTYDTSVTPRIVTAKFKKCGTTNNDPNYCAETRYHVNDNGNLTKKEVIISGTERATTVYTWSTNNWLVEMKAPNHLKVDEETKHTTRMTYTESGQPQKITTPDGKETLFNYDTSNNLINYKDPMNSVNGISYDSNNNPLDSTDSVGNTVMRGYDSYGNLTSITAPLSLAENYVSNSGFEHDRGSDTVPYDWSFPVLQAGEVIEVDRSTKLGGYKSLHLKAVGTDGAYSFMKYPIPVSSKMTYSISGGIKAGVNTAAELRVTFKNGATVLSKQTGLLYTKAEGTAGEWMKKSTLLEAPEGATTAELEVFAKENSGGVGEAWFDNLIFEGGTGRTDNILNVNSGFDHDFDKTNLADGWYPYVTNPPGISIYYADKIQGIASEKINGDPAVEKYVEQNLIMLGSKGTKLNLSGWSKQVGAAASTGAWEMQLVFYKPDIYSEPAKVSIPFTKTVSGWQQRSQVVVAPVDFTHVGIKLIFSKMPNGSYALFDEVKLSKLNTTSSTISQYNYIGNTSFEYDYDNTGLPDGWYVSVPPEKESLRRDFEKQVRMVGVSEGDVYTGEKALEVTAKTGDVMELKLNDEEVPTNGNPYTVVGYIKTANLTSEATIFIKGYDSNGNDLGGIVETTPITGTSNWKRVSLVVYPESFTGGIPQSPKAAMIKVGLRVKSGSGKAYFDNVRLQEGKFATEFNYNGNYPWNMVDPLDNRTDFEVDQNNGQVKSVLNPMNHRFSYNYDVTGRIKTYTFPYQGQLGNAKVNKTFSYEYDANGNLKSITDPNGEKPIEFTFSELNTIKSYTEKVSQSGTTNRNTWVYQSDEVGRMSLIQTPDGRFNDLDFDMAGRVKSLTVGDYHSINPLTYQFTYDFNGNLTSYGDDTGKTTLSYDNMNRVTKVAEPTASSYVANSFDDAGRRSKAVVHHKDGSEWTTEYLYDSTGKPKGLKDGGHESWFLFDESGKKRKVYHSNSTVSYYERDFAGRLTEIVMEQYGAPLYKVNYQYDKLGQVTNVKQDENGAIKSVDYVYDSEGQLLQETHSDQQTIGYAYDVLGNRTKMTVNGAETNYVYNAEKNRLVQAGDKLYQYDKDGNVINDGTFEYRWNALNKISLAKELKTDNTTLFYYDAFGRLTEISYQDGSRDEFHYDGDLVAYYKKFDSSGTPVDTFRFTYDQDDRPVFITFKGNQYWYHYDKNGNVMFLTDASGKKVAEYKYTDAWGNHEVSLDNSVNIGKLNPYRYAGYWYNSTIKKYDLKARMYDPVIGRFLSKDPVTVRVGDQHGLNSFAYAENNPVAFVDPSGLISCPADEIAACSNVSSSEKRYVAPSTNTSSNSTSWGAVATNLGSKVTPAVGAGWAAAKDESLKKTKTWAYKSMDFAMSKRQYIPKNVVKKAVGAVSGTGIGLGIGLDYLFAADKANFNFLDSVINNVAVAGISMVVAATVFTFLTPVAAAVAAGVVVAVAYTAVTTYNPNLTFSNGARKVMGTFGVTW